MSDMTFHLCDYCAKTDRMRKLLAVVRAAKDIEFDWKDSDIAGTLGMTQLRQALDTWEDIARRNDEAKNLHD